MSNDFYSVDKLLEFGLPANAANQMIDSMNQAFDKMKTPGFDQMCSDKTSSWADDLYYVVLDGEKIRAIFTSGGCKINCQWKDNEGIIYLETRNEKVGIC